MRILKFNVTNNTITRDSESDFSMLSKESSLKLIFSFSEDWDGYVKVAGFLRAGKELEPKVLLHGTTCEIPYEALCGTFFRMMIYGKKGTDKKQTRQVLINLNEK